MLTVIALSGAAVVFEGPVSAAHAVRVAPRPGSAPLPLDTLAARATAAANGGTVLFVGIGPSPDLAYGFGVDSPGSPGGGFRQVTIDPYTGAVLETPSRPPAAVSTLRTLHLLHVRLMAGTAGGTIVVLVTISALILVLTGLVIWWREKLWRINRHASWKRIAFDIHHSFGVFTAPVLLLITCTGAWVHFEHIDDWMRKLDRTPRAPPPEQRAPEAGATPVPLDSILRIARAAVPGAAVMAMRLPPTSQAPVVVQMRYPEDRTPGGRSLVFIDRYRGTVLRNASTRLAEPGTRLVNLKRSLHTGDVLGAPTQVIWFLAAIALAAQAVTGVLMWWNGRAARRAEAIRKRS